MRGYQQAHEYMNLRIRGCEDTSLQASTHKPEDRRMQGCKQGHMNLRIWRCRNGGYKHVHMHIRIGGCEDERIQATAQEPKDMRMRGYKQVKHIKHVDCF